MNRPQIDDQKNTLVKIIPHVIRYLSLAGVVASLLLILSDIRSPGFCAKLMNVPACYPVFLCYFSVFFSAGYIDKHSFDFLFWVGSGTGLFIAVWFSYLQIAQLGQCPKWFSIPLCYVSFLTFLTVIDLKILTVIFQKRFSNQEKS